MTKLVTTVLWGGIASNGCLYPDKHQLLIVTRSRRRGPHLHTFDRVLLGLCSLFLPRSRLDKVAVAIRPSTLLGFRQCLVRRNYRALFSPRTKTKPGPKGPSEQLIRVIVELKCRNPGFGCPRIALIISRTFGVDIDKDVVRRVLAKRHRPAPGGGGPSWRTFFGHFNDSLRSVVLHRCKSLMLEGSCILVVMAQFARRLINLGASVGSVDQIIFDRVIVTVAHLRHGSSDHRLGFEFGPWHAKLPTLEIEELSSLPYLPRSPPLADGSTHTPSRELNDTISSWSGNGLEPKLADSYDHSTDRGARLLVGGDISVITCGQARERQLDEVAIRLRTQCLGPYELPLAA